nr:hypothetical protein CFP56_40005 [Quercus suber]
MGASEFGSPPSYRDKLMGEILGAFAQAFNLSTNNEGVSSKPMDLGDVVKDMIAMTLTLETRRSIQARWTHAIIVKVFGRMVGFHFFHAKKPNFRPSNATCNLVAVWLRLPELPFEFYDPGVLKEIGSAIGPVLRVDSHMASEARGRYALICVQVDLNKPLIRSILLEGMIQEIQYEGINTLCFSYGRVGHRKEGCSVKANLSTSMPDRYTRTACATKVQASAHGSKAKLGMGNPPKRENHGSLSKSNGTSKSKPNHDLGVVRLGRNEGVESHFPLNTGKQKDGVPTTVRSGLVGVGKPLVDIPLRQTVDSRSESLQLESPIAAFASAKLKQIGSGGRRRGKENMDTQNDGGKVLGK